MENENGIGCVRRKKGGYDNYAVTNNSATKELKSVFRSITKYCGKVL